jgi:ATP-dependent RNA helicase DDX49/DBP8
MWRTLKELGMKTGIIHSFLTQKRRTASLLNFKNQKVNILLATDVACRGLDVKAVDLVINYDIPYDEKTFVHRVGRASRAGKIGLSISLITQYDLDRVKKIEDLIGEKMEKDEKIEEEASLNHMSKIGKCKKAAEMVMSSKKEDEHFSKLRKRKQEFREGIL